MAENPLSKLPLIGQVLVSAGLGAAICAGFYFFFYTDKSKEFEKHTAELISLKQQIQALEVTVSKLAEFQEQVKLLEAKLERLKLILPPQKETPDLMKKLQALASQSSLSIKKFNPGSTVSKDFYQEWPINIDLEGNYHSLGTFFDRVSRLPRLVNAGNIKIRAQSSQRPTQTILVSCVATTFVYVDKPPTAAAPAKGKAKGRGKK
jgi:type IV pilus assembly protein PilO